MKNKKKLKKVFYKYRGGRWVYIKLYSFINTVTNSLYPYFGKNKYITISENLTLKNTYSNIFYNKNKSNQFYSYTSFKYSFFRDYFNCLTKIKALNNEIINFYIPFQLAYKSFNKNKNYLSFLKNCLAKFLYRNHTLLEHKRLYKSFDFYDSLNNKKYLRYKNNSIYLQEGILKSFLKKIINSILVTNNSEYIMKDTSNILNNNLYDCSLYYDKNNNLKNYYKYKILENMLIKIYWKVKKIKNKI